MSDRNDLGAGFDPARSAVLSDCGTYRYRLERQTPGEGATAIIMVNPSTADAENDDATIRKLIGFGQRHRWGKLLVGNLFAYRATDVRALATADDPVGPVNDLHLQAMADEAQRVVLAWGPQSKVPLRLRRRWANVWGELPAFKHVYSIGSPAKCGHPKHPLMLAYAEPIIEWVPNDALEAIAMEAATAGETCNRLGPKGDSAGRNGIAQE